jgi:hypothetical protein
MTEVTTGVVTPEIKPETNKIAKYFIIAAIILGSIWIARKFIFKS